MYKNILNLKIDTLKVEIDTHQEAIEFSTAEKGLIIVLVHETTKSTFNKRHFSLARNAEECDGGRRHFRHKIRPFLVS